jgi:hypothetical protein
MSRYSVNRSGRQNKVPRDPYMNWRNFRALVLQDHGEAQPAKACRLDLLEVLQYINGIGWGESKSLRTICEPVNMFLNRDRKFKMMDSSTPAQKQSEDSEDAEYLLKHVDDHDDQNLQWSSPRRSHRKIASNTVRNPLVIANILLFLLSTRGFWLWLQYDRHVNNVLKESSLYCK